MPTQTQPLSGTTITTDNLAQAIAAEMKAPTKRRRLISLVASAAFAVAASPAVAGGDPLITPYPLGFGLPQALDLTYALTPDSMPNVMRFGAGNMISYTPFMSCLSTSTKCGSAPTNDHQRTSALFSATSQIDNQAEEQTVGIETQLVSGAKAAWAAGTNFAANANVSSNNNIYRAAAACTSGSTAPTGYGNASQQQTDGSGGCTWTWINAASIAGKLSLYIETGANGGAGFSEGLVTNFQMQSAAYSVTGKAFDVTQGAFGVEHDFKNNVADCALGTSSCLGMHFFIGGPFKSTAGISMDGGGGSHPNAQGVNQDASTFWGLRFVSRLASEFDIDIADDGAKSAIGIGVDGFNPVTHSGAAVRDGSTSPASFQAEGANATAAFNAIGSGNSGNTVGAGLHVGGAYSAGIALDGTFSNAQISGKNFLVYPDGTEDVGKQVRLVPDSLHYLQMAYDVSNDRSVIQSVHTGVYNTNLVLNPAGGVVSAGPSGFQAPLTTPSSSTASCIAGQFVDDASYHYVCTATNKWRRVALSDF